MTEKTDEEWEHVLTPGQYRILREKGTVPAFSGKYYKNREKGKSGLAGRHTGHQYQMMG